MYSPALSLHPPKSVTHSQHNQGNYWDRMLFQPPESPRSSVSNNRVLHPDNARFGSGGSESMNWQKATEVWAANPRSTLRREGRNSPISMDQRTPRTNVPQPMSLGDATPLSDGSI
nr:uncharacterized protein LOC111513287 isoform X2 [Leptinotarsa decemlineata]XP_023025249.1 uncharacterized protein LOC111513287 isoform X2 [Leptinotarsa decemlineata]XP_023025250.1 uncharacterized protein LOC111513287 isoform X2 [Leptinotarsa decemlineata]XP_023025251.1 uncharacterized protein LOC111513287 isoform X2 [Leptinotarsa decemlineata]XP_023025252.1 uncharacterized protein LOC111513287 isoform X2 [Leptinotarsa decemlineata]